MKIAFDDNTHTFYEGFSTLHGARPISHSITFTQATFIASRDSGLDDVLDHTRPNEYKLLFREDSFDPVTKIRRGRFYSQDLSESNPKTTMVMPLPGVESLPSYGSPVSLVRKELCIFKEERLRSHHIKSSSWPLVVLGWKSSPTFWKILQIENISTGEELVYLRSRSSIGVLPDLDLGKESFSSEDESEIVTKLESLSNDVHVSTAQSIVDNCRDLAEVLLRSKVRQKDSTLKGKELKELIGLFEKNYPSNFRLIPHYSQIIRQLHQRRKTAIQDKTEVKLITEEDSELAIHCISSMIRDLGIAAKMSF